MIILGASIGSLSALVQGVLRPACVKVLRGWQEGREYAAHHPPLVAVVSRALAAASTSDALSIPLAPGGALVLYRVVGSPLVTLSPTMQRAVMADLTLPLERNRLVALVQHVGERVKTTGRGVRGDSSEEMAEA